MDGGTKVVVDGAGDSVAQDRDEVQGSAPSTGGIKVWVHEVLDWIIKLLPVVATVLVAMFANDYKASLTAATLLSEREKADSQLRSEMFSKLVDPISGTKSENGVPLEREQLLAELLSLNFHEHINLRPLLGHVDARLARASVGRDQRAKDALAARKSFRAVAAAVTSRQTAMLVRGDGQGKHGGGAQLQKLDIGVAHAESDLNEKLKPLFKSVDGEDVRRAAFDEPLVIQNPDRTSKLLLVVSEADWENETFQVSAGICSNPSATRDECGVELAKRDFELSWFDFPLTDNILLADGTRVSIVLDQIYDARDRPGANLSQPAKSGETRRVRISVVWFPKDYISARERPTNHREFMRSLNLKNG